MTAQRQQIVGMSATLSNGAELANWLGATLHVSDYRPVPLDERVLVRTDVCVLVPLAVSVCYRRTFGTFVECVSSGWIFGLLRPVVRLA